MSLLTSLLAPGSGTSNPDLASGYLLSPPYLSTATLAMTDGIMYGVVFDSAGGTAARIGVNCTVAGAASSVFRFGAYRITDGLPGELIEDFGTVAADTTGDRYVAGSFSLPANRFLLAVAAQGGAPTVSGIKQSRHAANNITNLVAGTHWGKSAVSGALPTSWGTPAFVGVLPMIYARA